LLSLPAGGEGVASSVACGQDPYCVVLVSRGGWYQVTVSSRPSNPLPYHGPSNSTHARAAGRVTVRECPLICCLFQHTLHFVRSQGYSLPSFQNVIDYVSIMWDFWGYHLHFTKQKHKKFT